MIFGEVDTRTAAGALLAHAVKAPGVRLKKGHRLSDRDVSTLSAAGIDRVVVARLEESDVHEDDAATALADALLSPGLIADRAFTGRVNLRTTDHGVLVVDAPRVDAINAIDEAITIATLERHAPVAPGRMVATIKMIPFAVSRQSLDAATAIAIEEGFPVLSLARTRTGRVDLIQTVLPSVKPSVLDSTAEITRARLSERGVGLAVEARCAHAVDDLVGRIEAATRAGSSLVLIMGASAITDRRDVLPAAIEAAGGTVEHFGMPVDPGNLLLLASLPGPQGAIPVLGLPGCARSPKLNGFDWVLARLLADLPVTARDVMGMGVGGLLTEIPTRPQPRAGGPSTAEAATPVDTADPTRADRAVAADAPTDRGDRVWAVVLAAGRSRRMGAANKLILPINGEPMVRRVVAATLASRTAGVVVVTGHEPERVRAALDGTNVRFAHTPAHAEGLSTSLRAGLDALPADAAAALICLGDMPLVGEGLIDRLVDAYARDPGVAIVVPVAGGRRGNPVLWDRRFFQEMRAVSGDQGGRSLLDRHATDVCDVQVAGDAPLVDVDTPEAYGRLAADGVGPRAASANDPSPG